MKLSLKIAPDHPIVIASFLLFLSLAFTYPAIFQLSTHIIGGHHPDVWQFPRSIFTFREQILQGNDPYYTDYVFYPVGTSLLLSTYLGMSNLLGLVLYPYLNDIAICNLGNILSLFLCAVGVYVLAKYLTGNTLAALFAAIAFAFCPFRLTRSYFQLHVAVAQGIPFTIWAFLKMADTQRTRYALLTGLFYALTCYSSYLMGFFTAIALVLIVICGLILFSSWRTPVMLRNLVSAFVAALLVLSPLVYLFYRDLQSDAVSEYRGRNLAFADSLSADVIEYFRPAGNNSLVAGDESYQHSLPNDSGVTPGLVVMITAAAGLYLGIRQRNRKILLFGILAILFLIFSLGPIARIKLSTEMFRVPLPYYLITRTPFLDHSRIPERFALLVALCTAVLSAHCISTILRTNPGGRGRWLCGVLVTLLAVELAPLPFPMTRFDSPKIFHELAKRRDNGAMLVLPLDFGGMKFGNRASINLAHQIVHRKRVLNGRIARPPACTEYFLRIPIAGSLQEFNSNRKSQKFAARDARVSSFFTRFFQIRYIAVFPPYSEDDDVTTYLAEVFPDAMLLSNEQNIHVFELPQSKELPLKVLRRSEEIEFFLLENWTVRDWNGKGIFCPADHAKLLLPPVTANEMLHIRLNLKPANEDQHLKFFVGKLLVGETTVDHSSGPVALQIPGEAILNAHRVLKIEAVNSVTKVETPRFRLDAISWKIHLPSVAP